MESSGVAPTDSRTSESANAERDGDGSIRNGRGSVGGAPIRFIRRHVPALLLIYPACALCKLAGRVERPAA